ncbi:hypothetical protein Palpr_0901 [Paludibacter propionicigenes WB4]|uniref:Uncharacterized protein n=1 Tax=Paludibacter propionicigenes (strain DSM 17365 / JCM 13257 / WB4) TaxID=694427 RepID=E4T2V7_PALPW|nr:hypothetical protein [Paludibacter propionicigenes]ADQ79051.1 hypothetical protein Palpr_0901 [Paludibacter propionicigenes WB4]
MKRVIISNLFILFTALSFGQKLTLAQKESVHKIMTDIGKDDQKYRWQLMLGELDSVKLDSLKKLPDQVKFARIKKVMKNELGFNKSTKDSILHLQNEIDSLNNLKFLSVINQYGYPSFKRTGSTVSSTLILHLVSETNFKLLESLFKTELYKKNMPAEEFAKWFDRCQIVMNKKQLYGEYDQQYPCVENIKISNTERKKIGLKKLKNNDCR